MKRKNVNDRYTESLRKQQRIIDKFIEHETEWANDLLILYRCKKLEMPDDEYRGTAFFLNNEYRNKPGSLTLLYQTYLQCQAELPEYTKETGFDLLRFRYKMYAKVLAKGGF